jgi:hypothetical protein
MFPFGLFSGEQAKRKETTFETRRKSKIKNYSPFAESFQILSSIHFCQSKFCNYFLMSPAFYMHLQSCLQFKHPKSSECRIHTVIVLSKFQKKLIDAYQELCLIRSPVLMQPAAHVRPSQRLTPCDHRCKLCCKLVLICNVGTGLNTQHLLIFSKLPECTPGSR